MWKNLLSVAMVFSLQTVKREYTLKKATLGPEQSIVFKDTSIILDIPREGKVFQDQWRVFPTIPPKVISISHNNQI